VNTMPAIQRDSLMTLEAYAKARKEYRARVIPHKKTRTVHLGEHVTLMFEDEQTMRYQIQEMLLSEKAFQEEAIQDELDVYNPLVPDGSNWKATMLIEYPDVAERKAALAKMIGIKDHVWIGIADQPHVYAIADEDLERSNKEKTSSVHFLRFELTAPMKRALKDGAVLSADMDHPNYSATIDVIASGVRGSLLGDLVF